MSTLTEHIVLSRTRAQDLNSVRKLNCWGSELSDVGIVRKMSFVEVLSLSVNKITTLADFAHCRNLQELYLRKNSIQDLNEVCYLQCLPRLHSLWLADNPCAERNNYRLTVLRALPNLEKLDNIFVQPEEVNRAKTQGDILRNPSEASNDIEQNVLSPVETHYTIQESFNDHIPAKAERVEIEPEIPIRNGDRNGERHVVTNIRQLESPQNYSSPIVSPIQAELPNVSSRRTSILSEEDELTEMVSVPYAPSSGSASRDISPQHQHAFHARVQTLVDHSGRRIRKTNDINCENNACSTPGESLPQIIDSPVARSEDGRFNNDPDGTASTGDGYRHIIYRDAGEFRSPQNEYPNYSDSRGAMGFAQRSEKGSPARFLQKGGKNRNSNILSAVLCLVKELDYASLEVVETAIHCRMEEMDD